MKVGYARVSTQDRQLHLQVDALQAAGGADLVQETVSTSKDRPQLQRPLTGLRAGDPLAGWKPELRGRSLKDLVLQVTGFLEKGKHFVSLHDHLNPTTAQARLLFNLLACLAEFGRGSIGQRKTAGLTAARARGRQGGLKGCPGGLCQRPRGRRLGTCNRTQQGPKAAICAGWAGLRFTATSRN
ncbi:recombinase family protein [Hymenobacter latericus]|uniref:recombinase family protein n=1 Tax=Hymenobacter sp. YIM 151858-1 TaxID=2987688 RepID=UPI002225F991|nr:recombinase family protein [Hymenobacter sp. YIM 151858-1]UYZ61135.1 recombinase family protein [Hymenobacter sp. YIM 151858-1]